MNAVEYVRHHVTHDYYHGMHYNREKGVFIGDERNYPFVAGKEFTEDQIDQIDAGELLDDEIQHAAARLLVGLQTGARQQFLDWEIPIHRYKFEVEFEDTVCWITFVHRKTEACICLNEVYFNNQTGEILQSVISFHGKRGGR